MPDTIPTPTSPAGNQSPTVQSSVRRFKLNHPKNYLAVPLAMAADADTEFLIREYAVNLPDRAREGAEETNLVTADGELTSLGEAVVSTGVQAHQSPRDALEAFGELYGSPRQFTSVFPDWAGIARRVAFQYDVTRPLVSFLREQGALTLDELTWLLWKHNSDLAASVFLHPVVTEQYEITAETRPRSSVLTDASVYRSECTFQLKAFLYHCGVVASRGNDTANLDPETDVWELAEATDS